MSIAKFILKEIKLIKSQRIALILVVIYPILILITLAMVFSGSIFEESTLFGGSQNKIDVVIYIPESTKYFNSQTFFDEIKENKRVNFHLVKSEGKTGYLIPPIEIPDSSGRVKKYPLVRMYTPQKISNAKQRVKEAIQRGVARVGIVVIPPEEKNQPIQAQIMFDNSALLASSIILSDTKFVLEYLSGERSREILTDIWEELGQIRQKIREEADKINFFVAELDKAENRLLDLKATINSIDIATMKTQLESFDYYYLDSRQKIQNGILEAQQAKEDTQAYRAKLLAAKQELEYYNGILSQIAENVRYARDSSVEPIYSQLNTAYLDLTQQIQKISQSIADIDQAIIDIDAAQIKLENAIAQLNEADNMLVQTNQTVIGFRETVNTLSGTIDEVNVTVEEAIAAKRQTVENLNSTKQLLENLIKTLDDLRGFDPTFLTQPLEISQEKIYLVNNLTVMTPIGIVLVILLTALLLTGMSVIFDKEQGASFRVSVSPTTKFKWLTGKVIGQLIFALMEAMLIIVLGVIFFGIQIQGNIIELLIGLIIVSLTFITLGLFITNFTKTQSTTILATLLITVPMIFLSGIVFPHEFMPEFIAAFGKILPLTLAIEIISTVMVKGLSLITVPLGMIIMLLLSLVFFISTLFNKDYLK